MAGSTKRRRVGRTAPLAAGLLALGVVAAGAAEPKAKDRTWPTHDETMQTATGCEYMGKGYMKAPGTDTCIKMSGYVRSEVSVFGR